MSIVVAKFPVSLIAITLSLAAVGAAWAEGDAEAPPEARVVPRQLIRPDSLTGWETLERETVGWAVDGRKLIGGRDSQPLVSDWRFGDFELVFTWQSRADGRLQVQMRAAEADPIMIALHEQAGAGAIFSGEKPLDAGTDTALERGKRHTTRITRWRERVTVKIDDDVVSMAKIDPDAPLTLALHVPRGVVSITNLTVSQPLGEPLFNGEDLTGWWSQRKQDGWKVEDGELVGQRKGGSYLRSEREFGDFTLSFDYKISEGGNSGVGIRTPREGWPSGPGMELQILDRPGKDADSQMSIYKHFPPLERPDRSGQWNHVVIKASGRIITAWVNGQIAQHRDTATYDKTANKPLSGWIGFQDHGATTLIRNVYILESP